MDCLVVGAGLAGLACALRLHQAGRDFLLVDAAEAPGGRVRTDAHEGFLLDRGFQVLLTAYPEAQRVLDYQQLHLQRFFSGAFVQRQGQRHLLADPWRHPLAASTTLLSPLSTWGDRLRIGRLRAQAAASAQPPADRPVEDISTADFLRHYGFSQSFQQAFLHPFFRGIFLEPHLHTSARMFHFVFGMMARGETSLPLSGMQAIPRQLANRLPSASLRMNTRCVQWTSGAATLTDGGDIAANRTATGTEVRFRHGILATDAATTAHLLGLPAPPTPRATTCLYFAAQRSPLDRPAICLNGDGRGIVNHVAVPSDISPRYAPPGAALVSVTLIGSPAIEPSTLVDAVRRELAGWFGDGVRAWSHLRTDHIPFAQPNQDAGCFQAARLPRHADGTWLCGDHLTDASIDGALRSGRFTAEAILDA